MGYPAERTKLLIARCTADQIHCIKNGLIVETKCECLHQLATPGQTPLCNGRRLPRRSPRLRRPRSRHVRLCLAYEDCRTCLFSQSTNPRPTDKELYQRFGNAIVSTGTLNLRHASFANDFATIEADCTCPCCRPQEEGGLGITRAYIHHVASKETAGAHLYVLPTSSTAISSLDTMHRQVADLSYVD